jgi:23S rRNA (guanosine2251-2'-O)-methyltransferase
VRELLSAGIRRTFEVLFAEDLDPAPVLGEIEDLAMRRRVPVRRVGRARLERLARTDAPQGVLARAEPLPVADLDDLCARRPGSPAPFLLAVDGVTDPGNLGALLRSAEGAGVTGLVLPRHRAAHVTQAFTKAAAGAIEHVPIAVVSGLPAALRRMSELGIWSVGLDSAAEQSLFDMDLAAEPLALVLGAEDSGLSRLTRQRCDVVASIPLRGHISSLNVAAAGAVACFEIARRR